MKYCTVEFTNDSSSAEENATAVSELLDTGVWFLHHKELLEEYKESELSHVYATNIPLKYHKNPEVLKAKDDEMEKWARYDAFEEVEQTDQHVQRFLQNFLGYVSYCRI